MILGVGLDLVEIARIERSLQNPRFRRRILTAKESEQCRSVAQVAGRWAAKEAVAKAVGVHLTWQQVEILNAEGGKPIAKIINLPKDHRIHVTITHERGYAAAVAILEQA